MEQTTRRESKSICVMIGDVSQDFSAELMQGIFDASEREGIQLLYLMGMPRHSGAIDQDGKGKRVYHHNSVYDYATLFGADAYILSCGSLSGFENESTFQSLLQRFAARPYVILQESIPTNLLGKTCITIDNYSSFCQCIEHLIVVHHLQKIALLAGIAAHPDSIERVQAYCDTMEKFGLPVSETMIEHGDFSEYSDYQASLLIDNNPGLEAIACCNDEMAKGCYRVCAKRGLKVGRDIAITGFDDFPMGRSLMPPLTTISQNTYQMGEMAVMQAISLLEGKQVDPIKQKTKFHIRRSCGCFPDTVRKLFLLDDSSSFADIETVLKNISADLTNVYSYSEKEKSRLLVLEFLQHIHDLLSAERELSIEKYALADWLQSVVEEYGILTFLLAKRLNDYILQMPEQVLQIPSVRSLYDIFSYSQGFLFSYKASMVEKSLDDFRAQSWFIPELIRDLVDGDSDEEGVFLEVVKRLHAISLNQIYICLLTEPRRLSNFESQNVPCDVLLAAYHSDTVARSFSWAHMPLISAEDTLRSLPDLQRTIHMMSFSIFSGDMQYGILMCEADVTRCSLLHVVGLQLGILTNFLEVKRKEKIIASELDNTREKNEILNFLNEYDPLCNILNRRGFIERAIRLNRDNIGKNAICVFLDLDHLKEINDAFGHVAGDTSLVAISDILRKTVRSNDLVARLGGDEFVVMFVIDVLDQECSFKSRLKQELDHFNDTSGYPYYVEASMGMTCFACDHKLEIATIVNNADQLLYEEKKNRRPSALRHKAP